MKNIVLTGFMASGKTEIGKALAHLLNFKFVDIDDMVVDSAGKSINKIFEENGEEYFRHLESLEVENASKMINVVIATGGGTVLNPKNIDILRGTGLVFNLEPTFEIIKTRLEKAQATRPLLRNQNLDEIKKRFESRKPFYDNCDYKIKINDNSKTPLELAKEVIKIYNVI